MAMSDSSEKNALVEQLTATLSKGLAAAAVLGTLAGPAYAADYTAAAPPPTLAPQVARQPRAVQPGTPEKWAYSKFLDNVEKDNVEKVTFSYLL